MHAREGHGGSWFDDDGDPVLFADNGPRNFEREQHPHEIARFRAKDWEHAKRVFDVLMGYR